MWIPLCVDIILGCIIHTCILYSGKFSWGEIFADGQSSKFSRFDFRGRVRLCTVQLYLFRGSNFADSRLSAKSTKIGPHENFGMYLYTDGWNWSETDHWWSTASVWAESTWTAEGLHTSGNSKVAIEDPFFPSGPAFIIMISYHYRHYLPCRHIIKRCMTCGLRKFEDYWRLS
jgi:hypothetical protein